MPQVLTRPTDQAFPRLNSGEGGMTLREYFAAAAMTGILAGACGAYPGATPQDLQAMVAEHAVALADALVRELNKSD